MDIQAIARSDSALLSWIIPKRATMYHAYLVVQELLVPINDGAGLNITTNEVTIYSVFFVSFKLSSFFQN